MPAKEWLFIKTLNLAELRSLEFGVAARGQELANVFHRMTTRIITLRFWGGVADGVGRRGILHETQLITILSNFFGSYSGLKYLLQILICSYMEPFFLC